MKKSNLYAIVLCGLAFTIPMTSCIGNFALTKRVLAWNNQVGNKFLNELVFVAFWILPVYEVSSLADLLVLNSIEFWSGKNPMTASTKVVDTDHGRYMIACDGKGYTVTNDLTGESVRLDFSEEEQIWSVETEEGSVPFMTFVDSTHVKMINTEGNFDTVELSEAGLLAYQAEAGMTWMAQK